MMTGRLMSLDVVRGIAIVLMMMFHFSFDLNFFHIIEIDIYRGAFWRYARWVILSLFLFAVGYSLVIAYKDGINWKKLQKRALQLGLFALVISVVTYQIFPRSWIYFGVLHFILLATFLGLLFVRLPWVALGTAIVIFIGYAQGWLSTLWLYKWLAPVLSLPRSAEDLVPLFPWFAVVLLGIFAAHKLPLPSVPPVGGVRQIAFLGRHSLVIYMIHQPIFFGLLFVVSSIFL